MSKPGMISETLPCGESSQRVDSAVATGTEPREFAELGLKSCVDLVRECECEEEDGKAEVGV